MLQFLQYYGRFQEFRGRAGGMPGWARFLLLLAAMPGILLGALSAMLLLVSILTLLLLAVPVYRLLSVLTGGGVAGPSRPMSVDDVPPSPGRRHVDVTIIE